MGRNDPTTEVGLLTTTIGCRWCSVAVINDGSITIDDSREMGINDTRATIAIQTINGYVIAAATAENRPMIGQMSLIDEAGS